MRARFLGIVFIYFLPDPDTGIETSCKSNRFFDIRFFNHDYKNNQLPIFKKGKLCLIMLDKRVLRDVIKLYRLSVNIVNNSLCYFATPGFDFELSRRLDDQQINHQIFLRIKYNSLRH